MRINEYANNKRMKLTLKVENLQQEETWETFTTLSDYRTSSTMSQPPSYFTRSSFVASVIISPSGGIVDSKTTKESGSGKTKAS